MIEKEYNTITNLTIEDIQSEPILNILQTIKKTANTLGKGNYNEDFKMSLDMNRIVKIESERRHSYTFLINDSLDSKKTIRNLVLSSTLDNPSAYNAYIFSYHLDEADRDQLANGKLLNIARHVNLIVYNPDLSQTSINSTPDDCWELIVISPAQPCNGVDRNGSPSNHMPGDICHAEQKPKEAVTIIVLKADCDFGGGGPGSISDPWANPDLGSGAGGGEAGNNPGNVETHPNPQNPDQTDPVNEFEGITTMPLLELDEESKNDPCSKIKKLLSPTKNPGAKAKLVALASKTSDTVEHGLSQTVDGTNKTFTPHNAGSNGSLFIDPPTSGKFSFLAHTHNAPANSTYSVFSWWDLADGLYQWIKNNKVTDSFVYFVFTADNTYYAITIEDPNKFTRFFAPIEDLHPSNIAYFQKQISAKEEYYQYKQNPTDPEPKIKEGSSDANLDLEYFLQMLQDNDVGLNVLETDQNLASFKQLSLEDNTVKRTNCK